MKVKLKIFGKVTSYLHFSQNLTIRLAISDFSPNLMHVMNIVPEGILIL